MMDDEAFKQAYRDFVMRQSLDSEDGDLEIEADKLTPLDSASDAFRAFLKSEHSNSPNVLKLVTAWFDKQASEALSGLRQGVGIVRRATREGDRWTMPLSKYHLCQIINKHSPVAQGKPVGSNGSRFFKVWIVGQVDWEEKSKQRYIYNYEHLCSVFGEEEMAHAADELGAD